MNNFTRWSTAHQTAERTLNMVKLIYFLEALCGGSKGVTLFNKKMFIALIYKMERVTLLLINEMNSLQEHLQPNWMAKIY